MISPVSAPHRGQGPSSARSGLSFSLSRAAIWSTVSLAKAAIPSMKARRSPWPCSISERRCSHSPEMTGEWEHRLSEIEHGQGDRRAFMDGIAAFAKETVDQIAALDKEKLRPERAELGPCPRCGAETGEIIRENSKAYGCTSWKSREEAGCGFVVWKRVASRTLTPEIARQLIEERRTREVLSGFRSRNGKPFRARLVLNDEDKIEFEFPVRAQTKEPAATE